MQVSVTERCQMKCIYCTGWKKAMRSFNGEKTELPTETMMEIIRCGVEAGLKDVHFTGGEPFLREDLADIVRMTTEMGARVEVNTNGLLITSESILKLKDAGCKLLKISLDTPGRKEFERIQGIDAYEKIVSGIKIAKEILPVRVNCVVMRSNLQMIYPLIKLMDKIGAPRVHLLDLTYYAFSGGNLFWRNEFVPLLKVVKPLLEEKTGSRFSSLPIYGCSFNELRFGNTGVVIKEANPTMRGPHCADCLSYCHEGIFSLRLSAAGYLNACPSVNNIGVDAIAALRCGKLPSEYQRFSKIFDEAKLVESFPIFLEKNRINFCDQ
ncbi:MAG: radical SAM protein [Candidatus Paceibacterota bacterium]